MRSSVRDQPNQRLASHFVTTLAVSAAAITVGNEEICRTAGGRVRLAPSSEACLSSLGMPSRLFGYQGITSTTLELEA